jgi:hypothetical protein
MNETAANQKTKRRIKSFRVSPAFLELLEGECQARNLSLSEFMRQSAMANLRFMKKRAIECWSRQEL